MNRTGRVPDLQKHPERGQKLMELVAAGCSLTHAIEMTGIPESVVYSWMQKGGKPGAKAVYVEFAEGIKKARREFVLHHLAGIKRHAVTSWQAHAWMLERTCPQHFGPPALQVPVEQLRREVAALHETLKAHGMPPIPNLGEFDISEVIIDPETAA